MEDFKRKRHAWVLYSVLSDQAQTDNEPKARQPETRIQHNPCLKVILNITLALNSCVVKIKTAQCYEINKSMYCKSKFESPTQGATSNNEALEQGDRQDKQVDKRSRSLVGP